MRRWGLAVLAQCHTFLLLTNDPLKPLGEIIRQHHARQRNLGIGALDQPLQLTPRTRQRDGCLTASRRAGAALIARLLDKALELFGVFGPALTGFLSRDLQGDRQELIFIAVDMRIQEREYLLRRHARLLSLERPR